MPDRNDNSSDTGSRVISFRRNSPGVRTPSTPPVEDLAKYERSNASDDYRHRMVVNVTAFVFVIGLIIAGILARGHHGRHAKEPGLCVVRSARLHTGRGDKRSLVSIPYGFPGSQNATVRPFLLSSRHH